ncbi:MAG: 6-phosphogluconolactonase [Ectothiorhodospiraceae bacterium]|nr:6-phosphogluconolactonase [Ectothiorhodospiraceae bacterium]
MHGKVQIYADVELLLDALTQQWWSLVDQAITERGAFHVALAGGSTPRNLYLRLAQTNALHENKWENIHIYFGDERCVPQDHPDSNYRMAMESLLSKVSVPASNIHAMNDPALDAEKNAAQYANVLEQNLVKDANGRPVFDMILLGMGDDGHTASLFPDTDILHETSQSVAAQFVEKLAVWRISLTYPTINAARHVALLIVGEAKATILADISKLSQKAENERRYPVQSVIPHGELNWYLDEAAAQLLE